MWYILTLWVPSAAYMDTFLMHWLHIIISVYSSFQNVSMPFAAVTFSFCIKPPVWGLGMTSNLSDPPFWAYL